MSVAESRELHEDDPGEFGASLLPVLVSSLWDVRHGWRDLATSDSRSVTIPVTASGLQYGQSIFEGMQGFVRPDGSRWLFRPNVHAARFAGSASRLALPILPADLFVIAAKRVMGACGPALQPRSSTYYLRPTIFGISDRLGVLPADRALFAMTAATGAPYFANAGQGISLWLTAEYARVAPGGTGGAKCAGNYGGTLLPQVEARRAGFDQVLYTSEVGGIRFLDEAGTMNIFIVLEGGKLVTPSLGTALDGVTRSSILELAAHYGLEATEEPIPLGWFKEATESGRISEIFGTGTAAGVVEIAHIADHGGTVYRADTPRDGSVGRLLGQHLEGVKQGARDDDFGWLEPA